MSSSIQCGSKTLISAGVFENSDGSYFMSHPQFLGMRGDTVSIGCRSRSSSCFGIGTSYGIFGGTMVGGHPSFCELLSLSGSLFDALLPSPDWDLHLLDDFKR